MENYDKTGKEIAIFLSSLKYMGLSIIEISLSTHLRQIQTNIHIGRATHVKKSVLNHLMPSDFKNSPLTI